MNEHTLHTSRQRYLSVRLCDDAGGDCSCVTCPANWGVTDFGFLATAVQEEERVFPSVIPAGNPPEH